MPWVHLHVAEKGMVKACCVAPIPFGNVNTASFNEIWNGDAIQATREQFLSGQPDNRCKVCINQELAGAKSIRQETWEKYPNLNQFPVQASTPPSYFDIRFSNVCNFRCRTCWHGASSKWHREALALKRTKSQQAILLNINDFNRFIQHYGQALIHAKEIYFAGGEPLITEAHYRLLEWLIEQDATAVKLRYNTNFSTLKFKQYDVVELWKHFHQIDILASIDADDKLGEYIRKDMDWQVILDNRKRITPFKHIHFKLAPTVSILSIFHLPELYQTALKLGMIKPDQLYFNIIERPYYYNVKAFPSTQKEHVVKAYDHFFNWARENAIPQPIIDGFKSCLDFMNHEDLSQHWKAFIKETQTMDELREEKLSEDWYNDLGLTE